MGDDTKSDDQQDSEKKSDNQADNKDSKAEAHWQKIAEERRVENERLKKEAEEAKKNADASENEKLQERLNILEKEKERENIEREYPDIEPEFLLGRSAENQKEIVEKQRARFKEHSQNSIDVNDPQYSQTELAEQIDSVKKSNKQPIDKAKEVMRLNRLRRESPE